MSRKINRAGLDLIKGEEKLVLFAYDDAVYPSRPFKSGKPKGTLTIGYGHTRGVRPGQTITEAKANQLLVEDLATAERAVESKVKVPLSDNQFAALVSFVFNVGISAFANSTLLRRLNAGDYRGAADEMLRWNKTTITKNGKKVKVISGGLERRRPKERALFLSGKTPVVIDPAGTMVLHDKPDLSKSEIYDLQQSLKDAGYTEVGRIDGIWGERTANALSSAKVNNGLPNTPDVDGPTLELMDNLPPRPVSAARATATVSDMKEEDVPGVKGGSTALKTGVSIASASAASGAAQQTGTVETVDPTSVVDKVYGYKTLGDQVHEIVQWAYSHWWIFGIVAGIFVALNAQSILGGIKNAFRSGRVS